MSDLEATTATAIAGMGESALDSFTTFLVERTEKRVKEERKELQGYCKGM